MMGNNYFRVCLRNLLVVQQQASRSFDIPQASTEINHNGLQDDEQREICSNRDMKLSSKHWESIANRCCMVVCYPIGIFTSKFASVAQSNHRCHHR